MMKATKKRILSGLLALFMMLTLMPGMAFATPETEVYSMSTETNMVEDVPERTILSDEYQRGGYTLDEIRAMLQNGEMSGYERVYRPDGGPITYPTPIEEVLEFYEYFLTEDGARSRNVPYAVHAIVGAGRSCEESIVLVLLGDGFTAGHGYGQIGNPQNPVAGTFLRSAHEFAETITNLYPFYLFSDLFKIYAVETPSLQSGIRFGGSPVGPYPGTYLGTYFSRPLNMHMTTQGRARALAISNGISSNAAMTQVIGNSREVGGRAYWSWADYENTNTVGVSSRFISDFDFLGWDRPAYHYIVVHEIGHNFGQLVDEHVEGFGAPNMAHANMASATDTDAELKWGHWLGHEGIIRRTENAPVGYIFPSTYGTCKMQGWVYGFCRVCSSELVRRMTLINGELFEAGRRPDGALRPTQQDVTVVSQQNRILPYAFHGNRKLETVTIPASVETIGDFAFIGTENLTTIHNGRVLPQEINNTTFAGLDRSRITVYIPQGTRLAYIDAGWYDFNLVEVVPDYFYAKFEFYVSASAENDYIRIPVEVGQPLDIAIVESALEELDKEARFAFLGWFTEEALNVSGRRSTASNVAAGLRRPVVGTEGFDTSQVITQELLDRYARGGVIHLRSVWSLWGDVNDDGRVDHDDIDALIRNVSNLMPRPPINWAAADVFRDGVVDHNDIDVLTRNVSFLVPRLVMGQRPEASSAESTPAIWSVSQEVIS
ncbi:MAG: M64 family metallo-endopeptidase, partial [Oscillospiraceae bacterium]|nr:M64 family metallo-endopeptidase [Oscillospiraceae bacterium]